MGPSSTRIVALMAATSPERPRRSAAAIALAVILVLATAAVVAGVFLCFIPIICHGDPIPPQFVTVSVTQGGGNWTVLVTSVRVSVVWSGAFLTVTNPQGTALLSRIAWSSLTAANASATHAMFLPSSPSAGRVSPGDRIQLEIGSYAAGSLVTLDSPSSGAGPVREALA